METQRDSRANLRPFVAGDPRINRQGGPKGFDEFRRLAQAIAHEKTTDKDGNPMTVVERLLRSWAESKEPVLQKAFIEYAFGKVPDKPETTGLENKPVLRLHFAHEESGYFDKHPDKRPTGRGKILLEDAPRGEGTRRPLLPDAG